MGKLIVVEGIDGAGKNTLVSALVAQWREDGAEVGRMAFPRYGQNVHADLIRDALHGDLGDLGESVNGMALLFALDRRAAAGELRNLLHENDVVLVDRYIASGAAYSAARLHQDAAGEVVEWTRALEVDRFGIPVPDAQVLLDVPAEVAAQRAQHRERQDATRKRDTYEADGGLQQRCADVYAQLAQRHWLSPWHVVDGSASLDVHKLSAALR